MENVMSVIKNKLNGLEDGSIFQSDDGHVQYLIDMSINIENLSNMYVGWAPFL